MVWLEALLAFAVTMMVLSTVVSAIVEAGHSLLNQRSKGLERLMQHMFDKTLAPKLAGKLPADMTGSRFVKQMTDRRWIPIDTNASKWKKTYYKFMNKLRRHDKAQKLTTLEFIERLAETPIGTAVLDASDKVNDKGRTLGIFLEDIASKYEDFGDDASQYFARRARFFSIVVGFFLVFSINFNAVEVTKTLLQSEATRDSLIQQGDAIAADLNKQLIKEEQAKRQNLLPEAIANLKITVGSLDTALAAGARQEDLQESDDQFAARVENILKLALGRLEALKTFTGRSNAKPVQSLDSSIIKIDEILKEWKEDSKSLAGTGLRASGIAFLQQARDAMKSLPEQIETLLTNVKFDPDKVRQSVREGLQVLQQAQLPVGWEHAPWNSSEWKETIIGDSAKDINGDWWKFWTFIKWFGSVLIAGLLVGLGGPFWFDTYRKMAAVAGVAKAFQSEVKKEVDATTDPNAPLEQVNRQNSDRFKRIFTTSREASDFAKATGRQPLTNDGTAVAMGHVR